MKARTVMALSAGLLTTALAGLFAVQFLSGGRNPADPLLLVLMLVIGASAEAIALAAFRNRFLKMLPLLAAAALAAWGSWLYLFSESWAYAAVWDLVCGYVAPLAGAVLPMILVRLFPIKNK